MSPPLRPWPPLQITVSPSPSGAADVLTTPFHSIVPIIPYPIGWIDDDFPDNYPRAFRTVQLVPEDTEHYKIYGSADEQAFGDEEWESQFPLGGGWVHLGPQNRSFSLTHWHALHCLGRIRQAMIHPSGPPYTHTQHCLTYFRELALCRADLTLEPVLNAHGNVDSMYTHECKDWTALYYEVERNYLLYRRKKHPG